MTGIVEGTAGRVLFCSDKFLFTFMTRERLEKGQSETITPEDGFVFATAHNGKRVAIYTGNRALSIDAHQSTLQFYTELFFVSEFPILTMDLRTFRFISFRGGVLDRLKPFDPIKAGFSEENEDIISVERSMKSKTHSFSTPNGICEITTGVFPADSSSEDSMTLKDEAYLTLTFEKNQPLSSFTKHFQHINRLVSFMTFRTDVTYGEIQIIPDLDGHFTPQMHVFVYYKENEKTAPHYNSCVSFDVLGAGIASLLDIFYNSKQKKPSYSLGFIPSSDDSWWIVTDDTVRAVSSALECEADLDKELTKVQSLPLHELCSKVEETVKEHREQHKGQPVLTDGTYNLIFGSIRHWSMSAFDRISFIFHKHEKALKKLPRYQNSFISDDDIHAFISYRNSISHGTHREMTQQIKRTTLILEMLVYCCLLARIGVSNSVIEEICSKHIE